MSDSDKDKARPRILLIDDSVSLCKTFVEMCRVQNLEARVETCHDGSSAIDLLLDASTREYPFKIVIVDVFLPKDGAAGDMESLGVKILTAHQLVLPGTPIIVITAWPTFENCVKCLKAGAYDYLPKGDPSNQSSFLKTLVERCQSILYPEPDPVASWLCIHNKQISRSFAGSHIAIVKQEDAKKSKVPSEPVGDYVVVAGKSMAELRLVMLKDHALRWTEPNILYISEE